MSLNLKKDKNYSLHSKISEKYRPILKKLALSYGSIQKVIEEAIELIQIKNSMNDKFENETIERSKMDEYRLTHLMINNFKMLAVGRKTFLSYIDNLPETPIKENNAIELIEWFYDNKFHISTLSLLQILIALKKIWIAGKYFTSVQIQTHPIEEIIDQNRYKIVFTHDFNENFGTYWTSYFQYFLTHKPNNFKIEHIQIRNQSFYFNVVENIKKPSNIKYET